MRNWPLRSFVKEKVYSTINSPNVVLIVYFDVLEEIRLRYIADLKDCDSEGSTGCDWIKCRSLPLGLLDIVGAGCDFSNLVETIECGCTLKSRSGLNSELHVVIGLSAKNRVKYANVTSNI